jgi:glycosyltransferase involved in cell wall biosynthesis
MTALVSVVIPCYKDSATLGRAIRSVVGQTYPNIEIIVVNDCSPETEQIEACLKEFPQVCYLRNPVNVGLAATRNNGLAIANGEMVALLDADDEYRPEKIKLQIEALEPNTVVTCGIANVYPDGHIKENDGPVRIIEAPQNLLYRNTLNGAGLLAPKELLMRYGGFDATLRSCEDFDLWLRLLSSGIKVKDIGKPLYLYHFNPLGLSKNFRNISKWDIEAIQHHADRMGAEWRSSYQYASVVTVWLLRHLLRSELTSDVELRQQAVTRANMLTSFPFFRLFLIVTARARLFYLPAMILRRKGGC